MRPSVALLLPLLLSACLGRGGDELVLSPLPLSPQGAGVPESVLSLHRLEGGKPAVGGLSGIAWDGDDLVAVSDTGTWLRLAVRVDEAGRPQAVSNPRRGRLGGVMDGKRDGDAEDLLADGDGWLVTFERRHRLWRYGPDLSAPPQAVDAPAAMVDLAENDGVEAMARLADGRLLLIAEGDDLDSRSPAWIGGPGAWRPLSYPHHQLFRPTAAVGLPDGGVLVLERQYTVLAGPAMRLVRVEAGQLAQGDLTGTEVLRLQSPLTVDNFEGVTLRRRADGRLVAIIVSDDNFNPLQVTLLLTVLLP